MDEEWNGYRTVLGSLNSRLASRGGPYAAIYDLSGVTSTTLPTELVRSYARCTPPSQGAQTIALANAR
jgi:hypothetical protein